MARTTGIDIRHQRSCRSRETEHTVDCNCRPSYQAHVWSARDGKRIRKTFPTLAAAKTWRSDALVALRRGELRPATRHTLGAAVDDFLAGVRDGRIRAKGGRPYKPSTIASYEASLRGHVIRYFGANARLADVTEVDVQAFVDEFLTRGVAGQTIRNCSTALSVLYRYARRRGWIRTTPTGGLELPAGARRRERVVDPGEAQTFLDPLAVDLRALYGCAIFAGLRRGEIAGLEWSHVRFDDGSIVVERSYCWRAKAFVEPKSTSGRRTVPMVGPLAGLLLEHRIASGGHGLVFPSLGDRARPFDPRGVARRADTAWKGRAKRRAVEAGQDSKHVTWDRLILHVGRHSAASAFIASGLDPVRVSKWMGHSQVSTTTDIYAKAFEAREERDMEKVNAFFESWSSAVAEA